MTKHKINKGNLVEALICIGLFLWLLGIAVLQNTLVGRILLIAWVSLMALGILGGLGYISFILIQAFIHWLYEEEAE